MYNSKIAEQWGTNYIFIHGTREAKNTFSFWAEAAGSKEEWSSICPFQGQGQKSIELGIESGMQGPN